MTPGESAKQAARTATPERNSTDERRTKERVKRREAAGTGEAKGINEPARKVYGGGNGASGVMNVGRRGGGPMQQRLQDLLRLTKTEHTRLDGREV